MEKNNLSVMDHQRGASALTVLIMVLFFGSLLILGMRLGPAYMNDITIREALESLDDIEGLSRMAPAQIRILIGRRLSVNNIRGFDDKAVTVDKNGDLVVINIDYEVRNNLFSNVDAVIHFQHNYEMKGQ